MSTKYEQPRNHAIDIPSNGTAMFDIWKGFIIKVYGILCFQLLITIAIIAGIIFSGGADVFYSTENHAITGIGKAVLYISLAAYIIAYILIACFQRIARQVPWNYGLMLVVTIAMSLIAAVASSATAPRYVILAAGLTITITVVLTIYAWKSKTDISYKGALFYLLGWYLVMTIVLIILHFVYISLTAFYIGGSVFIVCIYGFFIIYNTKLIIGGKRGGFTVDDYILAAVLLYTDIISLFISLLGGRK